MGLLVPAACGGSGGGSPAPTPPPAPTTPTNPCSTTSFEELDAPAPFDSGLARQLKAERLDGNPRWRVLDALWTHRARASPRVRRLDSTTGSPGAPFPGRAIDVGEIAVMQDEGDLIDPANVYDLRSLGLRYTRNGAGGYDVRRIDGNFRGTLGTRLTLTDDDSAPANVPFEFPFYGRAQTVAFVNSDGNITFEEGDKSSSERNVARLLTGPPRVSPFLADLDPTTGAGRVFVHAASGEYTVTWCNVRGFEKPSTVTVQATLLPDGTIEMKFGETINLGEALVGLSPGKTGVFTPVNLSDNGPTPGGAGAIGERFARQAQIDTIALTKKFYATHPDDYDQLVIWSDAPVVTDSFAYETTVANEVRGLGVDVYDLSREFGSAGRLRSLAVMDFLGKYPETPTQKFLGENNTLSVLGQEVGHRWLAFFEFRDHTGQRSDALLGRDLAHWSYFFDSDASVMEGNNIEDLGGGSFRTTAAVQRYSLLDQYAMGLVSPDLVPAFFYVESPTNLSATRTKESSPQAGVTFNGTRREHLVADIIAIHGPRVPPSSQSARVHRQAFLYLVSAGRSADPGQVAKLDGIRRAWEEFFLQATDGRMTAITKLR